MSSSRPSNDASTSGRLSEAMLLALASGVAYWIAFTYERAYLDYFQIPVHVVQIGLELILVVFATLLGGLFGFIGIANFVAMVWPEHPALQEKVARFMVLGGLAVWYIKSYGFRREDVILFAAMGVAYLLLEIVWPILVYRREKSLLQRFIEDEVREHKIKQQNLFGRFAAYFGMPAYHLCLVALLGTFLAYFAGHGAASTQESYFLLKDRSDVVFVRVYPELLVGVPFEAKTRELRSGLVLIKPSDTRPLVLVRQKIGPLLPGPASKHRSPAKRPRRG